MSRAYIDCYSMDRPRNNLGCKNEDLKKNMSPEILKNLHDTRQAYKDKFYIAEEAIRAITNNNHIKNKSASFDLIIDRAKNWYNYKAFDYYMLRIGITPDSHGMFYEGLEYQMYELAQELESMLHSFGKYKGYNSIHWIYGNGFTEWEKAGEPDFGAEDDKENYIMENLGVFYY